jgi:hypothetical protein
MEKGGKREEKGRDGGNMGRGRVVRRRGTGGRGVDEMMMQNKANSQTLCRAKQTQFPGLARNQETPPLGAARACRAKQSQFAEGQMKANCCLEKGL